MRTFNHKNEPIVSFALARMLKDAGFDWKVDGYYDFNGNYFEGMSRTPKNYNSTSGTISAPTLPQSHDWMCIEKGASLDDNAEMDRYYDECESKILNNARIRFVPKPESLSDMRVGDRFTYGDDNRIFLVFRGAKYAVNARPSGEMEVVKVNKSSMVIKIGKGELANAPLERNKKLKFFKQI